MTCVVGNTSMVVTLVRLTCSCYMDASQLDGFFLIRYLHEKVIAHSPSLSVAVWRLSPSSFLVQNPTSQKSPKF